LDLNDVLDANNVLIDNLDGQCVNAEATSKTVRKREKEKEKERERKRERKREREKEKRDQQTRVLWPKNRASKQRYL